MDDLRKRTWAEISLGALRHNYEAIRARLPEGCRFLGVVKADAYGHGAVQVSRLLQDAGADYLAVSCLDEAMELRQSGIYLPILILGHTPAEFTGTLIRNELTQAVTCLAKAEEYSREAARLGMTLRVHIKLDTGMSRLGFLCAGAHFDEGVEHVIRSCTLPGLEAEGVFTHFAVSDEPGEDNEAYTRAQFALFLRVIAAVQERGGVRFAIRHCANSGAALPPTKPRAWQCWASATPTGCRACARTNAAFLSPAALRRSAAASAWTCAWPTSLPSPTPPSTARWRSSARTAALKNSPPRRRPFPMSCCAQYPSACRASIRQNNTAGAERVALRPCCMKKALALVEKRDPVW